MTYRNQRQTSVTTVLMVMFSLTAISPGFTQVILPGSPQQRLPLNQAFFTLTEPDEAHEGLITQVLPVPVNSGFLVMTEENNPSQAPSNWSDVIYFHNITVNTQVVGELRWISDGENGIADADLGPLGIAGLTTDTIANGANTQFRQEVVLPYGYGVIYAAPNPNLPPGEPGTTATLTYTFISDPTPEPSAFAFAGAAGLPLLGFAYRRLRRKR